MENLEDRLDGFLKLNFDWNGYGAEPISGIATATAKNLAVFPTPRGGVQFELHAGDSDVEIEIDAKGQVVGVCWFKSE